MKNKHSIFTIIAMLIMVIGMQQIQAQTLSINPPSASICSGVITLSTVTTGSVHTRTWTVAGVIVGTNVSINPTPIVTTTYKVTVEFGSMPPWTVLVDSVKVTVVSAPTATMSPTGAQSICTGDSLLLTATAGVGYSYLWYKDGISIGITTQTYWAKQAGSYTVTVSANGCSTTSAATTLSLKPLPIVNTTPTPYANVGFCFGSSTTFSTTPGYSYQWQHSPTGNPGTWTNVPVGGTSNTYVVTTDDYYRVVATLNGCSLASRP